MSSESGYAVEDGEHERILRSLTAVGHTKPVGYLPLNTVASVLGADPAELAAQARSRGLSAIALDPGQCCIKSGALYVYHRAALRQLLRRATNQVRSSGLSTKPDEFVRQIAAQWFEPDHPIQPIIRAAFGDIG